MILATLRTIIGRKGSTIGSAATALGAVLITIVIVYIVYVRDTEEFHSAGGKPLLDATTAVLVLLGVVIAIVLGALAGSYDTAQGTMRYLLLAGPSRWSIYLSRAIAVLIASWLVLIPALVVALIACVVLPTASQDAMTAANVGLVGLERPAAERHLRADQHGRRIAAQVERGGDRDRSGDQHRRHAGHRPAVVVEPRRWATSPCPRCWTRSAAPRPACPSAVAVVAFLFWMALFLGAGWWRVSRDEY